MTTPIFITDEMFEKLVAPKRNNETATKDVIDWCKLPVNVIYQVKFVIPVRENYADKVIVCRGV